jgi:hypothetical protein
MEDARFTIPTPALLAKVVDLLDDVPMEDRDTKGDLYEYMLGQDRHGRSERPVPYAAPHHPADGRGASPSLSAAQSGNAVPASVAGHAPSSVSFTAKHTDVCEHTLVRRDLPERLRLAGLEHL